MRGLSYVKTLCVDYRCCEYFVCGLSDVNTLNVDYSVVNTLRVDYLMSMVCVWII